MSRPNSTRLALFTRYPVAGQAKTRLIPAIGSDGAAAVHRQLTEKTVATLRQSSGEVEIHFTGAAIGDFKQWLGEDIRFLEQPPGDLAAKLVWGINPPPVIFFGSDTPDLGVPHVEAAIDALLTHDVVIGPAEDGGYYLIGMRAADPGLFADISWSTDTVLSETLDRAKQKNLTVKLLETLSDCDTPEDLVRWPWLTA